MNLGFWFCIVLVPVFLIIGILFAALKEKSVRLVSGFGSLSKQEQELCDKARLARDMRNSYLIQTLVMLIGAVLSYLISSYMAIAAYAVWGVLFFKNVHFDEHKAFEKYLPKSSHSKPADS